MTIAYFLHVDGAAQWCDALQDWADHALAPTLNSCGRAVRIEAYTPQSAHDPYLGSETGKLLLVQADFMTRADLEATLSHASVLSALAGIPAREHLDVTAEAFTPRHFPLLDGSTPPRQAPTSFVVRYYPPTDDPASFAQHYIDHHPPIMARFPRIRNILCYLPLDWHDASGIAPSGSFLGNEVVFDNIEDLNAALASDVRHALRADYELFPAQDARNTHHAMSRRLLYSRLF